MKTLGDRIKFCIELTKLTKPKLAKKYLISISSLHCYENNTKKPSEKRLKMLLDIFKKENVITSYQWLKQGVGDLPREFKCIDYNKTINNEMNFDSIELINYELKNAANKYKNSVHFICNTFELEPSIFFGDWVLGIKINSSDVNKYEKYPFLFKINNITYLKYIAKINENGSLNLIGINQKFSKKDYFIPNVFPEVIAPIFWIRRNPDHFI